MFDTINFLLCLSIACFISYSILRKHSNTIFFPLQKDAMLHGHHKKRKYSLSCFAQVMCLLLNQDETIIHVPTWLIICSIFFNAYYLPRCNKYQCAFLVIVIVSAISDFTMLIIFIKHCIKAKIQCFCVRLSLLVLLSINLSHSPMDGNVCCSTVALYSAIVSMFSTFFISILFALAKLFTSYPRIRATA